MRKPYPLYKESRVEWIGKIPSDWDLLKIKNICLIGKGQGLSKDSIDAEGKSKCILYGELFTLYKDLNTLNSVISRTNEPCYVISNGNEILIPGSTTTTGIDLSNAKFLPQKDILLGGDIIILNPRKSDLYIQDYISFFLSYVSTPEFIVGARGVTIYHIYPKQIREMYIAYPPILEQKKIVNYLYHKINLIENLIEKTKQKIELLKEKRTSLINHCVTKGLNPNIEMKDSGIEWMGKIPIGWEVKKIKYFAELITEKKETEEKDIKISPENVESYTGKCFNFYSDYTGIGVPFKPGDILFNKLRLYLVKIILATYYGYSMGEMLVIRINKPNLNKFYFYLFFNQGLIDFLDSQSTGIKMPRVSPEIITGSYLPFPPIYEQQQIVEYIDDQTYKIDILIEKENKRIELLKEHRQSLISEVVTGKIDIRDEVAV